MITRRFGGCLLFLTLFVALPSFAAEPVALPVGIVLHLRNDTTVSTEFSEPGTLVAATVTQPFFYASQRVIPVASVLSGQIRYVKRPGRLWGRGELRLVFEKIQLPSGEVYSLQAVVRALDTPGIGLEVTSEGTLRSSTSRKRQATELGGGGGVGAVIGGVTAGPAGAAIGAGIGSGAMWLRRSRHAHFEAGTEFQVELTTPLQLEVN